MLNKRESKIVDVGGIKIGGGHPVIIQSMTNTDTNNVEETLSQIHELVDAGCEIVRLALLTRDAAKEPLRAIIKESPVPLVADIHYDYRIALLALEAGIDKLRINPGNLDNEEQIKEVVELAKKKNVPIRVGVNGGSLPNDIIEKYDRNITPEALVEAALRQINLLEKFGFTDIIPSIKTSSVPLTLGAYQLLATKVDYPFHIGITEAGGGRTGIIKSSVGIGSILAQGLGDTIRVSLTDNPVEEIIVAENILQSLELRRFRPDIISCPTCGRCQIDLIGLAKEVEEALKDSTLPIKVAVMGCPVNGPGEAKDADIGIAGGKDCGILFKKGEILRKVDESEMLDALLSEIDSLEKEMERKR